jgi:glycosyltransferase involved in cell wall biosynthesis
MENEISLIVIGKNSSVFLNKFINVFKVFNEIIFIDDYSSDKTEEKCKKLGIQYFKRHLNKDFTAQRNFALDKAKNRWVLFLDSDEEIDKDLTHEIKEAVTSEKYNGFYIKRKVNFLGHLMSGTEMGNDKVVRLAKKNAGKWVRKVHEYWDVNGPVGELNTPMIHNTAKNLKDFISKISFYFGIHAKENEMFGKRSTILKVMVYTPLKFLNNYFILKGCKDAVFGFVVSILMSFHTFLSWSESWLKNRSN